MIKNTVLTENGHMKKNENHNNIQYSTKDCVRVTSGIDLFAYDLPCLVTDSPFYAN